MSLVFSGTLATGMNENEITRASSLDVETQRIFAEVKKNDAGRAFVLCLKRTGTEVNRFAKVTGNFILP